MTPQLHIHQALLCLINFCFNRHFIITFINKINKPLYALQIICMLCAHSNSVYFISYAFFNRHLVFYVHDLLISETLYNVYNVCHRKKERLMYIDELFWINQFNMFRYYKHGTKILLFEIVHLKKNQCSKCH